MKKYNYKDNFEMLYLRHDYITKNKKMEGKWVKIYEPIVHTTAKLMYNKLYPNFQKVGFDLDDIIAIANVYMLGYMGLYSIKNNPEEYKKYLSKWRTTNGNKCSPSSSDVENNERNRLINFLRQRLQHCATICARKARNITVGYDRRGVFAETTKAVGAHDENILADCSKYGFRKVTQAEFKQIKKDCRGSSSLTDKDGFAIKEIEILNNGISHEDYSLIFNTNQKDEYVQNPEKHLLQKEKSDSFTNNIMKFNSLNHSAKRRLLVKFIEENKDNDRLKKEVTLARKMLKNVKNCGIIGRDE